MRNGLYVSGVEAVKGGKGVSEGMGLMGRKRRSVHSGSDDALLHRCFEYPTLCFVREEGSVYTPSMQYRIPSTWTDKVYTHVGFLEESRDKGIQRR